MPTEGSIGKFNDVPVCGNVNRALNCAEVPTAIRFYQQEIGLSVHSVHASLIQITEVASLPYVVLQVLIRWKDLDGPMRRTVVNRERASAVVHDREVVVLTVVVCIPNCEIVLFALFDVLPVDCYVLVPIIALVLVR